VVEHRSQRDAVIETMERNGGFATLHYLYENAMQIRGVAWASKTPFASMRRIVQDPHYFFKIRPGLWALNAYRDRLPPDVRALARSTSDTSPHTAEFSHAYYQGLAAELGQLKGYRTYVPAQDGGKRYAGRPLKDVANTTSLPAFTYGHVLRSARTIDVIWFNERGFPNTLIEVEHTTDFTSSFLKFVELADFRTDMLTVAHESRERQFADVLGRSAFSSIKDRVRFEGYERLALRHSRSYELRQAEAG
jgi:hypothetical protein